MTASLNYSLKKVGEEDAEEIQKIFEAAPDYSLRIEGVLPKKEAALFALRELPPDFDKKNKHCFGIYEEKSLIGFVDLLNGYPEKSIAYLGIFLLAEEYQKKGLGKKIYPLVENEILKWNSTKIRLSVAKTNDVSGFWNKMGFSATGRILNSHNVDIISQVIEMEKIMGNCMELIAITEDEFAFWKERSLKEYKLENMRANGLTDEEAEEKALGDFNRFLPTGLSSPDQYIFSLKDKGEHLGFLWFCEKGPADNRKAFVLDIIIEDQFRGKGFGKKAMLLLEEKVKKLGLKHIGLHVFGHNHRAYELYKKLGYTATNYVMEKVL